MAALWSVRTQNIMLEFFRYNSAKQFIAYTPRQGQFHYGNYGIFSPIIKIHHNMFKKCVRYKNLYTYFITIRSLDYKSNKSLIENFTIMRL